MSYEREEATPRSLVLSFGVLAYFVFLWPAVLTFDVGDWPSASQFPYNAPAANACGAVGAWLAYYLRYFLGSGVYPLLLFGTLAALLRLIHGYVDHLVERGLGVLLLIACTAAATHLIPGSSSLAPLPGQGGLVGAALGEWLRHSADTLGTIIVLLAFPPPPPTPTTLMRAPASPPTPTGVDCGPLLPFPASSIISLISPLSFYSLRCFLCDRKTD